VAFGLSRGWVFLGVVVEPWVLGLGVGFSGGFWVDGGLGFWSRRGGGAVGLGFGVGLHPVGHRFAVGLRWVLGFGLGVVVEPWVLGLAWALHPVGHRFAVGLRWVLGFGSRRGGGLGLPWVWVCLPWVFGFVCRGSCRGSWESTAKKKKKIKMRREKREMRREKKKLK
jgi:hypothetical protein